MAGYRQKDLLEDDIEDYLYEEVDPKENEKTGGFKTYNPEENRFQRDSVRLSPKKSVFKKNVEMILCIHGWEDESRKQPMTLLVFDCHLSCDARRFRYKSACLGFQFAEDMFEPKTTGNAPKPAKASPYVVAHAPFAKTAKWNDVEADIRRRRLRGLNLGAEYMAKAGGNVEGEKEVGFTRKHFDRGSSTPLDPENTGKKVGMQWYLEENDLTEYGIAPDFKLALLIKRSNDADGKGVKFQGVFDLRVEAGLQHQIENKLRSFFRLGKPEDDPIYFDPELDDHIRGSDAKKIMESVKKDEEGNDILDSSGNPVKLVRKDALGELAEGGVLVGLLYADDGLVSGLEPFTPRY